MSGITIQAPVTFTEENLNDLYVTAMEGGIGYWSQRREYTWNMENHGLAYAAKIVDVEQDCDAPDDEVTLLTVDRDTIVKGLTLLSQSAQYGSHWDDVVKDNADADTADVVVQMGLFGDAIYS